MTPEEMRIAIREAVKWKSKPAWEVRYDEEGHDYRYDYMTEEPDWLTDLNAMHEAEKVLFEKANTNEEAYSHQLTCVTHGWQTYHATAAQRAEAFCRTVYPERFKS